MMLSAFKNTDPGIQITYRTDGGVFNLHRLRAKTKVTLALIRELLYADDCAIVAHSEHDLQQLADSLSIVTKEVWADDEYQENRGVVSTCKRIHSQYT